MQHDKDDGRVHAGQHRSPAEGAPPGRDTFLEEGQPTSTSDQGALRRLVPTSSLDLLQ